MKKQIKKKYIINTKRIFVNISLLLLVLFISNFGIGKIEGSKHMGTKNVVILPSDTLWSIAKETCSNKNIKIENCMIQIKKINNLNNSTIYAGQTLKIPVY